jgi:molybdate transport system regulatory protein
MKIKSKFWTEIDGEPVLGRGRCDLLKAIEKYGSINRAAKEVNISYKKAWSYIKAMEERLNLKLVEKQTGGRYGGGAVLTNKARQFLKKYEMMEKDLRGLIDERFERIFGN